MDTLHRHGYDLGAATCSLVPSTGPVLCRDEMEEWSASEANLFEEALEKYGKDFGDIRHDFVSILCLRVRIYSLSQNNFSLKFPMNSISRKTVFLTNSVSKKV